MTFDVVVVGAGIAGAAVARECALAGMRVAVMDDAPGSGATSRGMGHVVAMDDSPEMLALTRYSRGVWQEQAAELPVEAGYQTRGTIWVAADDREMEAVDVRQKTYAAAGVEAVVLGAEELAREEPELRGGLAGGLFVTGDGVCLPAVVAAFYLRNAVRLGAVLYRQRVVWVGCGRVTLDDGSAVMAERIVLAVGAECELMPRLPIRRRKGHLLITVPVPGFVRHQVVELGYVTSAHEEGADSVVFNVQPRPDGAVMIGASRQYGSEETGLDADIVARLKARAREYMPGLAGVEIAAMRYGFRAATPDKMPLIGSAVGLSEDASLWLAAGFEGLGITSSPGAARMLVAQMLGRETAIDARPYLPGRFADGVNREMR